VLRDVPVDWEALEDAFENNAPEVHSYLHLLTGEVLRVVDGVADPQMHVRIASDATYLRIDPVSSREQYRWMERFIPMVEEPDLRAKLTQAIDGKGAFRRFKDVLMTYGGERERWFAFRSERLRTFMEAWLSAHAIRATVRPVWAEPPPPADVSEPAAEVPRSVAAPSALAPTEEPIPRSLPGRRVRTPEQVRQLLRDVGEALSLRDLETVLSFAEFLKARRAARSFAHHHEHHSGERGEAQLRGPASRVDVERGEPRSPDAPSAGLPPHATPTDPRRSEP
jgi:hypothetical protein